MSRHVGLLGLGQSIEEAPFADPNIEFWAIGSCWEAVPNWAIRRWYEMYAPDYSAQRSLFWEWAKHQSTPIYFTETHPDIPASVAYPRAKVERQAKRAYFTSSLAWMLAHCLTELVEGDEVSLWGINLSSAEEYRRQRPCVEYLLGLLEGRGIIVHIPDSCLLLKDVAYYGYFEPTPHAAFVAKHAVGGIDTIYINGVRTRGIFIDPDPKYWTCVKTEEEAEEILRNAGPDVSLTSANQGGTADSLADPQG